MIKAYNRGHVARTWSRACCSDSFPRVICLFFFFVCFARKFCCGDIILSCNMLYNIQLVWICASWNMSHHTMYMPGLLILCDGVISHNQPQVASDWTIMENLIIHEKTDDFNKIRLVNVLSGNMQHLHVISRWFALKKGFENRLWSSIS